MRITLVLAALAMAAVACVPVDAAKLTVISAVTAPAGGKLFTIGFDTEGAAGFLGVQDIIVTPRQPNPLQNANLTNRNDRQGVEDIATNSFGGSLANYLDALQNDSWWYASPNGLLQGITGVDGNGDPIIDTITTDPVVGSNGRLWTPFASGIQPALPGVSGTQMRFVGTYGPFPTSVGAGVYPLLQLRLTDDVLISGTLAVGQSAYNVGGGPSNSIPYIVDFQSEAITTPEPSGIVLAGMGLIAAGAILRRRK